MRTKTCLIAFMGCLLVLGLSCQQQVNVAGDESIEAPKVIQEAWAMTEIPAANSPRTETGTVAALGSDEIYWAYANSPQDFYTAWANQHGVTPPDNPNALAHVPNALELNGESWGLDDESPRILPVNQISAEQRATLRTTPHAPVLWHEDHQVILAGYAPHNGAQQILQFHFNEIPDD